MMCLISMYMCTCIWFNLPLQGLLMQPSSLDRNKTIIQYFSVHAHEKYAGCVVENNFNCIICNLFLKIKEKLDSDMASVSQLITTEAGISQESNLDHIFSTTIFST